jgi:hypothetical protein
MEEALVALACLSGKGCSNTTTLYYNQHPALKQFAAKKEQEIKQYVPDFVISFCLPIAAVAVGQKSLIKISKNVSLEMGTHENTFIYGITF